jgi:hypothetical protein
MTALPPPPSPQAAPESSAGRWIGVVAIVGITLVSAAAMVIASLAISLCGIGLGADCSSGERAATTTTGVGFFLVLAVGTAGAVWFWLCRRNVLLLAILAFVGSIAFLAGGVAGVQAAVGTCERHSDDRASIRFNGEPARCGVTDKIGTHTRPLALGVLLATTGVVLLVVDRRQLREQRTGPSVNA